MSDFDLSALGEGVDTPRYDRKSLRPRHVHLGFGAFARAHWMGYHQDYLHAHPESDWGVTVTDLKFNADRFGPLAENDHLYSVLEYSDTVDHLRIIGAIIGTAHPERDGLDGFFAPYLEPDLAIVSLTVTEKGYCLAGGELDTDNPEIIHDLSEPHAPQTAHRRAGRGAPPPPRKGPQRVHHPLARQPAFERHHLPQGGDVLCRKGRRRPCQMDRKERHLPLPRWSTASCRP